MFKKIVHALKNIFSSSWVLCSFMLAHLIPYFQMSAPNFYICMQLLQNYKNLIAYDSATHTNPPILSDVPITRADIDELSSKRILDHEFSKYLKKIPNHTQAVERSVKLVTLASQRVCGQEARNGLILNTLSSRKTMPKFDSKQDYAKSFGSLSDLSHFSV